MSLKKELYEKERLPSLKIQRRSKVHSEMDSGGHRGMERGSVVQQLVEPLKADE